jgi:hypothetical protein
MQKKIYGFIVVLSIAGLCIQCNKSIDSSGKLAYLSVTHAAPGTSALDVLFENNKLTEQLAYGSTTGSSGNLYLSVISGVHNFKAGPDDNNFYIDGNIGLLAGKYYSLFIYDTLSNGKLKSLLLQDGWTTPVDTVSLIRFLNLSPDTTSFDITIINTDTTYKLDTLSLGAVSYIGANPKPTDLSSFSETIRSGVCHVQVLRDSIPVLNDTITLTHGKIYTIYSKGLFNGSGATALGLGMIQHN